MKTYTELYRYSNGVIQQQTQVLTVKDTQILKVATVIWIDFHLWDEHNPIPLKGAFTSSLGYRIFESFHNQLYPGQQSKRVLRINVKMMGL
jgi:hypothetical protein